MKIMELWLPIKVCYTLGRVIDYNKLEAFFKNE